MNPAVDVWLPALSASREVDGSAPMLTCRAVPYAAMHLVAMLLACHNLDGSLLVRQQLRVSCCHMPCLLHTCNWPLLGAYPETLLVL